MLYEKPTITSVAGHELMEALGPAQAITSGGAGVVAPPNSVTPETILTGGGGRLGRKH